MRRFRAKFGNVKVKERGRTYASKAEARYARLLEERRAAGEVAFYTEQTAFRLPCGAKYIADFVVYDADGTMHVVDVKGVETDVFRLKKRLIEAEFPFEIECVKMPPEPRRKRATAATDAPALSATRASSIRSKPALRP